jgi:hypothetical protein
MTDEEWAASSDPDQMLAFLHEAGKLTSRKAQLFRVAVSSRVQHLLSRDYVKSCPHAISVQERYADGLASGYEFQAALAPAFGDALDAAHAIAHPGEVDYYAVAFAAEAVANRGDAGYTAQVAARAVAYDALTRAADNTVAITAGTWQIHLSQGRPRWDADEEAITRSPTYLTAYAEERACQATLLRDLFGPLPFRAAALGPSVLAWNDGLVVRLAKKIYDERSWEGLPILADALLDAGCDNDELVAHLGGPGPHTRGCYGLDLLLGKE